MLKTLFLINSNRSLKKNNKNKENVIKTLNIYKIKKEILFISITKNIIFLTNFEFVTF